ncbi:MAG: Mur ligase family protein [Candidatus Saccharimonadales bacterium]
MFNSLASLYQPKYIATLVYMLQTSNYRGADYLKWYWRTSDFDKVMSRRALERTRAARGLLVIISLAMIMQILVGFLILFLGDFGHLSGGVYFGAAIIIAYPVVIAQAIVVPLFLSRKLIIEPSERRAVAAAAKIFAQSKAIKIAIAGSYGKTSMKELLQTILGEGKYVAATSGNKNVAISHARFAFALSGREDIILIEYGEGAPSDVAKFAQNTHPDYGIITGLAPAHLERYKTLQAAGEDIFSLAKYLKNKHVYVNSESEFAKDFIKKEFETYSQAGALDWKISDVKLGIDGTDFTLKKPKKSLKLHSQLIGRHQLGALSLAVALAHEFGLSDEAIVAGVAKTKPFEHRMQPYELNGATIIDDTYNGNIEGIRAGTELLKDLPAKTKIYITPGLVDQGPETEAVHRQMGELIAAAGPDQVILMQNSVTNYIKLGLESKNFEGELKIEQNPLDFYLNLKHIVAAGDLVMLQNDWPDNYA